MIKSNIDLNNMIYFVFIFCFLSCIHDSKIEQYSMDIYYYKLIYKEKNKENISVDKINKDKNLSFIYQYKQFQEKNDTLIISPNSVIFNKTKLFLIESKTFKNQEKLIPVGKYLYEGDNSSLHLYINNQEGLMVSRSRYNDIIVEFDSKSNDEVNNSIIADSLFFKK